MDPLQVAPPASLVTEIQALQGAWVHGALTLLRAAGHSRLNPPEPADVAKALDQSEAALAAPQAPPARRSRLPRRGGPLRRPPRRFGSAAGSIMLCDFDEPLPPPLPPPRTFPFRVTYHRGLWRYVHEDAPDQVKTARRLRDLVRRVIIPAGLGAAWAQHPLGLKP
jgi:hypothetical protein